MNSLETKQPPALNGGKAIKCLSIIALVCTALTAYFSIYYTFFFYQDSSLDFFDLLKIALPLLAMSLFLLYILKFPSEPQKLPMVFGVLTIESLLNIKINDILNLIIFVACILVATTMLKGFLKEIHIIILIAVCLFFTVWRLPFAIEYAYFTLSNLEYSVADRILIAFFNADIPSAAPIIGKSSFFAALLIFFVKNTIPVIVRTKLDKNATPEQQLQALKAQRESDLITEEEYQAQRAEIISKL